MTATEPRAIIEQVPDRVILRIVALYAAAFVVFGLAVDATLAHCTGQLEDGAALAPMRARLASARPLTGPLP